jgi:hypothetical protein
MEFDAECVFVNQDWEYVMLFVHARRCGDYFRFREQTSLDSTESEPENELIVE